MDLIEPNLIVALRECEARWSRGLLYWWRPRTMEKLEARGLVEKWLPKSVAQRPRMKARPWRPTNAGIALLRAHREGEGQA